MKLHVTRELKVRDSGRDGKEGKGEREAKDTKETKDLYFQLSFKTTEPSAEEQNLINKYPLLVQRPLLDVLSSYFFNTRSFSFGDLAQGVICNSTTIEQAEAGERQIRFASEAFLKNLAKVDSLIKEEDFQL